MILKIIHPSLSILCYLAIFINSIYTIVKSKKKYLEITAIIAWSLCLGGLVSGMIWAHFDWGRYWAWDPKETANLFLFLSISGYLLVLNNDKYKRFLIIYSILNIIMVLVTIYISQFIDSIHTH